MHRQESFHDNSFVKLGDGSPDGISSVVGGFSSVSWAPTNGHQKYCPSRGHAHYYNEKESPGAFIFIAKDGFIQREQESQPVVWALHEEPEAHAIVRCGDHLGPYFSVCGFRVLFDLHYLRTGFALVDKSVSNSLLRNLGSKNLSELGVYSVCSESSVITSDDVVSSATEESTVDETSGYGHTKDVCLNENTRLFGASIAGALMEEEMTLYDAQMQVALGLKRVGAAVCALAVIHGSGILLGKSDPVVELNVRVTRMTTLQSTLQACPESVLAAWFNDSRWSSDGKYFGVIDCSPSIFSKVLDVLRMRKRAKWSKRDAQNMVVEIKVIRVVIAAGDRTPFEQFAGMYFPGCEAFVRDSVEFEDS